MPSPSPTPFILMLAGGLITLGASVFKAVESPVAAPEEVCTTYVKQGTENTLDPNISEQYNELAAIPASSYTVKKGTKPNTLYICYTNP